MTAKKMAIALSVLLTFIGVIDFSNRLSISNESSQVADAAVVLAANKTELDPTRLNRAQVAELLSWSDVKAKAIEKDVEPVVKKVTTPVAKKPAVVAKPPDVHKTVQAAIAGDVSKHLIGDELLSLKGIFYDGSDFASIEIENIKTKDKQYFTFARDKAMANFQLQEIGRYHVVLSKKGKNITLKLFE